MRGSGWDDIGRALRDGMTTAIATVTSLWLPIEIVSPPVPLAILPELDSLVPALRGAAPKAAATGWSMPLPPSSTLRCLRCAPRACSPT